MTAPAHNRARSDRQAAPGARRRAGLLRLLNAGLTGLGLLLLLLLAINAWFISSTRARVYDHIDRVGAYDVGLVLGTSPYTSSGAPNLLFKHRMRAAAQLYAAGKVQHLLVTGANPGYYNEPQEMYQALRRLGIPHDAITLDFAGYSTFDSIVRSNRVFGLNRYVLVSQRYHDYRALFIAGQVGIDAVAYVRPEEDLRQPFLTELREYFARVKAVLDLFVWNAQPRYLGPSITIDTLRPTVRPALACHREATDQETLFVWRRYGRLGGASGFGNEQPGK